MLVKSPLVLSKSARGLEEYNPQCQADLHVALLSMFLPRCAALVSYLKWADTHLEEAAGLGVPENEMLKDYPGHLQPLLCCMTSPIPKRLEEMSRSSGLQLLHR